MKKVVNEKKCERANLPDKIYDDIVKRPVQTLSNGLSMCLDFMGSIVSPAMHEYIRNAEYKKQKIDEALALKYSKIPEQDRINPRMQILGPAIDMLRYNLDEKHIKEIFVNILIGEMNRQSQKKVLPSYIGVVSQLSREDAKMLKTLNRLSKKSKGSEFPLEIICVRPENERDKYLEIDKYLLEADKEGRLRTLKINNLVADNLMRLGIFKIHDDKFIPGIDTYEEAYEILKKDYLLSSEYELYFDKGILMLTEYGKNFLEVCI